MNNAQIRTLALHLAGIIGSSIATAFWMSTRGVDVYGMVDNLNKLVVDLTGVATSIGVLVTTAYGVYRAATGSLLHDAVTAPDAVKAAQQLPVTPQTEKVAEALHTNGG